MGFKSAHARKLASLSALGAGALIVGVREADANVITSNFGGTPGKVGFSAGYNSHFSAANASHGGVGFVFYTEIFHPKSQLGHTIWVHGTHSVKFASNGFGGLLLTGPGATFGAASATVTMVAASRLVHKNTASTSFFNPSHSPDPFSNKFALFEFNAGTHTDFGWIQLALVRNSQGTVGDGAGTFGAGPDLKIISWAFDDTGKELPAGAVPEPGTFAMTGMGALALGALGIRRWRASKANQAA